MLKELSFPAKREFLPHMMNQITSEIVQYISDDKLINRLKVCAEEILVNIIDYSKSENVDISCELLAHDECIRFEFVDAGIPYNPLQQKPNVDVEAEIDERGIGGLGIFLYTTIMDRLEYHYDNGKNHLVTWKYLRG